MTDLSDLTLAEARDGLKAGDFSARELVDSYVEAMKIGRDLNAYITETSEAAHEAAAESDRRIKAGEARPLEGIPLGIKDLFCTEGVNTTAASRMLENFVPPYESTVSANLKNAGAVMLGKTNQDEFAMGSSSETSAFGPPINPWRAAEDDTPLTAGGSSGGSSAAVAGRLCLGATGTDTGGSIRQPASLCGITGMKPTYGRCSRWGIVAFASSLDQAGPLARNVRDTAILLKEMAGHDPKDSTSVPMEVPDYEAALEKGVKGLKVGIPKEYYHDSLSPEIAAVWEAGAGWLKAAGAEVKEISLPHTESALAAYYIIAPAEASSNLARYDGVRYTRREGGESLDDMYMKTRGAGFGEEVRRRILIGTYVLSAGYYDAYYLKAQKVRALVARDFTNAFKDVDVVLTPTAPTPAFPLGDTRMQDPVTLYLNDIFTVPTSLSGLPGLSVPAGLSGSGLPMGLQVVGRPFAESDVFRAGEILEKAAVFPGLPPVGGAQ